MRNVRLALVGLLLSCVLLCAQAGENVGTLAVYLDSTALHSGEILKSLRREASLLLGPAGVRLEWRLPSDTANHEVFQNVVVAKFVGACETSLDADVTATIRNSHALAYTPVQGERVLPFTRVDCRAVDRLTAASLRGEAKARRDHLFGRALGRVLAHEIYHILGQTTNHLGEGVAKKAFSSRELLSESFAFNEPAISVLRANTDPIPVGDDVAGR